MNPVSSANTFGIDLAQIRKIDFPNSAIRKLTPEEQAKFEKIREAMYSKPTNLDELKNHVSQKIYAEVKVNGQTVAKLYNSGAAETSNATAGSIKNLPSMGEDEKSTGPELAQKRAEEIAKALGGTIVPASSAVTAAQYAATPSFKVEYTVDYEAMERDRRAVEGRVATPQTQVTAQNLGNGDDTGLNESSDAISNSATDQFMDFMDKSWEEKVRAMILKDLDMTEEQLAALPADEREKIEAKILERIKAEVEKKTGVPVANA